MVTLSSNFLFNCPNVSIFRSCNRLILASGLSVSELLTRHMTGEWGAIDELSVQRNHECLKIGSGTVLSSHYLIGGENITIRTDLYSGETEIEICPHP